MIDFFTKGILQEWDGKLDENTKVYFYGAGYTGKQLLLLYRFLTSGLQPFAFIDDRLKDPIEGKIF